MDANEEESQAAAAAGSAATEVVDGDTNGNNAGRMAVMDVGIEGWRCAARQRTMTTAAKRRRQRWLGRPSVPQTRPAMRTRSQQSAKEQRPISANGRSVEKGSAKRASAKPITDTVMHEAKVRQQIERNPGQGGVTTAYRAMRGTTSAANTDSNKDNNNSSNAA